MDSSGLGKLTQNGIPIDYIIDDVIATGGAVRKNLLAKRARLYVVKKRRLHTLRGAVSERGRYLGPCRAIRKIPRNFYIRPTTAPSKSAHAKIEVERLRNVSIFAAGEMRRYFAKPKTRINHDWGSSKKDLWAGKPHRNNEKNPGLM